MGFVLKILLEFTGQALMAPFGKELVSVHYGGHGVILEIHYITDVQLYTTGGKRIYMVPFQFRAISVSAEATLL